VRKALSPVSYRARVIAISHEADLALLDVEDKRFWNGNVVEGDVPVEGMLVQNTCEIHFTKSCFKNVRRE
jgi:hypothetical protein